MKRSVAIATVAILVWLGTAQAPGKRRSQHGHAHASPTVSVFASGLNNPRGLAFGPDLDRVRVRLAIDATSTPTGADEGPSLFAYHGRKIESLGSGKYRVVGTFSGPRGAKAMEMTLESPLGHTALVVVTFSAKKQDFGDGWHDLIANVVPFRDLGQGDDDGPVRAAHAWLVTPPLATA